MKKEQWKKVEFITNDDLEAKFRECLKQHQMPDYFLYLGKAGVNNWLNLNGSKGFPIAGRLTDLLRESLSSLVAECRSENERNKKVLSTGAKVLSDALHFFHQALSTPPVYEETKKIRVKSASGAVFSRQA